MGSRAPTLIVFAREPEPYRSKTRLIRAVGPQGAADLAAAFILDAIEKARDMRPARLILAGTAPRDATRIAWFRKVARRIGAELVDQGTGGLGVRMARAMAPYVADGVILIGTDTPSLPARLLRRSIALLGRHQVVLGPSLDGGYYLIAVRGEMPDVFRGIQWGRGSVLAETIKRLKRSGLAYVLGPAWYDVDRPGDLALLAVHLERMQRRGAVPCPNTARALTRLGLLSS